MGPKTQAVKRGSPKDASGRRRTVLVKPADPKPVLRPAAERALPRRTKAAADKRARLEVTRAELDVLIEGTTWVAGRVADRLYGRLKSIFKNS